LLKYFSLLLLGASLIGLAPIFVRLSDMSPSWVIVYRMFLSLPFIAILSFYVYGKSALTFRSKKNISLCMLAGVAFGLDLVAWHRGIHYTSIANATTLVSTAPVFVLILSWMIFKESISRSNLAYFTLTYIGIAGLIYFSSHEGDSSVLGDILSLFAALCYACYLLVLTRLGKENTFTVIFFTSLFCGLFAFPFAIYESTTWIPTYQGFIELLALAILCQFGGQFLITYALPKVSTSRGGIGLSMQPITATIFGAWIFSEYLTLTQLFFVLIALTGIYLARGSASNKVG
jgi:drug/metabolite transporter (DMT)-like permease